MRIVVLGLVGRIDHRIRIGRPVLRHTVEVVVTHTRKAGVSGCLPLPGKFRFLGNRVLFQRSVASWNPRLYAEALGGG